MPLHRAGDVSLAEPITDFVLLENLQKSLDENFDPGWRATRKLRGHAWKAAHLGYATCFNLSANHCSNSARVFLCFVYFKFLQNPSARGYLCFVIFQTLSRSREFAWLDAPGRGIPLSRKFLITQKRYSSSLLSSSDFTDSGESKTTSALRVFQSLPNRQPRILAGQQLVGRTSKRVTPRAGNFPSPVEVQNSRSARCS